MKYFLNKKVLGWFIIILTIINLGSIVFYWVGHFINQRRSDPKTYLVQNLHFSDDQKNAYFLLAKEHNEKADIIRTKIKFEKENLFRLLQNDEISEGDRNNAALKVSKAIESLDMLTFEHFKKVRALCTVEQKPKFDELLLRMVNAVGTDQKKPLSPIK